ncbi:hypothetical protein N7509_000602 [Penicillium cosmopolitanum]|uniref:Uncharacterized protein n=1 Tax=Penicillium cosmopolitanum TaxID=1131564 RepID=A0A9X0BEC2_9EURO|nr:uncharacterized protein N7509_000602 [Penicillium cosmopolitanum]KAJ5413975.1 hypothetical protein N7509_000602 [Penicillium cosmopolitanum]
MASETVEHPVLHSVLGTPLYGGGGKESLVAWHTTAINVNNFTSSTHHDQALSNVLSTTTHHQHNRVPIKPSTHNQLFTQFHLTQLPGQFRRSIQTQTTAVEPTSIQTVTPPDSRFQDKVISTEVRQTRHKNRVNQQSLHTDAIEHATRYDFENNNTPYPLLPCP